MRIAIVGGGPAGLYFAISMKLRDAAHDITVFERNKPDDTFGWGVVLSDETLANLAAADPVSAEPSAATAGAVEYEAPAPTREPAASSEAAPSPSASGSAAGEFGP